MKIKFNWGTGIFLFYTVFASVLFFSVYKSTQFDHSLVVDEYYRQDLAYQDQYDRLQNTQALEQPLRMQWSTTEKQLNLRFPETLNGIPEGEIVFYRPDNKSMDWQLPIAVDKNATMTVDMAKLPVGRWKVQVYWHAGEVPYYNERIIDLR